jgi:CPA1 family monovalent cation:H+ antiporter
MPSETIFILLFIVATAVAIGIRYVHIPYTVGLVIAGLILGFVHALKAPNLSKELLFTIFLPGLLFEAAFHIDFKDFWRNRVTIFSLAVPGVIAATALTTLILTAVVRDLPFVKSFHWQYALVFGALIAATDPIAVIAMFKNLGAPKRLSILMEGESLLNDGTGIVFFTLSLSILAGSDIEVSGLAVDFIKIVGMGIIVGLAIGLAVSQVIRQIDDPMIEITLTTIAAYGAFATADQLGYSGVIATVTAGMVCGNYGARTGMSPSTRISVETFWEYITFALNSVVFLLIGFEANIHTLISSWKIILIAYLAITLGRSVVILGVSGLLKYTRERIPGKWIAILTWGGLRGALPMVLVLSLSRDFLHRDLLISITFGVVIISILLQGLTISPMLKWLGIITGKNTRIAMELERGRIRAANAALANLNELSQTPSRDDKIISTLKKEYQDRIRKHQKKITEFQTKEAVFRDEELAWARRHLILVERREIIDAFHQGLFSQDAYEHLLADIDARILQLESDSGPSGSEIENSNE